MEPHQKSYRHTLYASYIGYITQAIVNNLLPLLFLTLQQSFAVTWDQIALLVTLNFGIQLAVDLLAAKYVDRIGYRVCIVSAHLFAAAGLIGLSVFPFLFPSAYGGVAAAVCLYAVGGGLIEVLISPLVEACPTERKEAAMSLLHSFYCWGHVLVILLSTLFFALCGIENWRWLACLWAAVPLANAVYFSRVPIHEPAEQEEGLSVAALLKNKLFWVLCLLMVCAAACEQGMSQWASAFAESGLGVSKTVGDLAGPCTFAVMMGLSRALYGKYSEKISLLRGMRLSGGLCVFSYLLAALSPLPFLSLVGCGLCGLSVGLFWPGSYSLGARSLRGGGTALFALLALAGDLGCAAGPAAVGVVSDAFGGSLKQGLLFAALFPLLLIAGLLLCRRMMGQNRDKSGKTTDG